MAKEVRIRLQEDLREKLLIESKKRQEPLTKVISRILDQSYERESLRQVEPIIGSRMSEINENMATLIKASNRNAELLIGVIDRLNDLISLGSEDIE